MGLIVGVLMAISKLRVRSPMIKAQYKCVKCKHEYTSKCGPTSCTSCGHNYVTWINYTWLRDQGLFKE
jgi:rRNA maturation endonuclease Nob1